MGLTSLGDIVAVVVVVAVEAVVADDDVDDFGSMKK